MPRRDVAVPFWCECGKCCKTPKEDEYVCCKTCPCRSDEFEKYLKETLTKSYLEEHFTENFLSENICLSEEEKLRRVCYSETSKYFHRYKWYPQDCEEIKYTALPSCIVWTIRRHFSDSSGKYTGFPPKPELLQKVVDAHKTFRSNMDAYKAIVDATNPDHGLFTTLRKLEENQRKEVYEICGSVVSAGTVRYDERWTESTDRSIELLPRLGFVACATAFEAFVHDSIKRCFETVFPTTKVNERAEKHWKLEFKNWLKSRTLESEVWHTTDHDSERRFWKTLIPEVVNGRTKTQTRNQNPALLELEKHWKTIFELLATDPTSQIAVGLVQEMVDITKQSILGILKLPTMQCIQETFTTLAVEASHSNGKRKLRGEASTGAPKKLKRTSGVSTQSPLRSSSSTSSLSSDVTGSSWNMSTTSTPQHSTPVPVGTSTPLQATTPGSLSQQTDTSTDESAGTVDAIEYLISHYARVYNWQVCLDRASHDVNCADAKTLSLLSNVFYGMRCLFSHGTPEKTVNFGSLREDRIPQTPTDLNINVLRLGKTEEECSQTEKRCKSYLLNLAKDAKEKISQMPMDYDLFLTAQSFYAYVVEIIGSVAECIAYKYSDVKLRIKATKPEIQKVVGDAWSASTRRSASSISTPAGQSSMDIADCASVLGAGQQTTSTGAATGISQDFSDFGMSPD